MLARQGGKIKSNNLKRFKYAMTISVYILLLITILRQMYVVTTYSYGCIIKCYLFFLILIRIKVRVSSVLSPNLVLNLLHRYADEENTLFASTNVAALVKRIWYIFSKSIPLFPFCSAIVSSYFKSDEIYDFFVRFSHGLINCML